MQRTDPRRVPQESLLRPFQTLAPTKTGDRVVFRECGFFMWWIKAGPYRYWTTL